MRYDELYKHPLMLMLVNMFLWSLENNKIELSGHLEALGLILQNYDEPEVFIEVLMRVDPEKAVENFIQKGDYTYDELQNIYEDIGTKFDINNYEFNEKEIDKINEVFIGFLESLTQ